MNMRVSWLKCVWCTCACVLFACTASKQASPEDWLAKPTVASLSRASDCENLLHRIQADALRKLESRAELLKRTPEDASLGFCGGEIDADAPFGRSPVMLRAGRGEGVDAPDVVKLGPDARFMYVLHGSGLRVPRVAPVGQLEDVDSIAIDGNPFEMFVRTLDEASGLTRVVVFSEVEDEATYTKVTWFDALDGMLSLVRELYFEGRYVSSHLQDGGVRAVVQGGIKAPRMLPPTLDRHDAWGRRYDKASLDAQVEAWQARMTQDILNTTLAEWLPHQYERDEHGVQPLEHACERYYVPSPGLVHYGLVQVIALEITEPDSQPQGIAVLGQASSLFANDDMFVLAQEDHRWCDGEPQQTALHAFALDGQQLRYTASGFVDGAVAPFSMDEADGSVRVATTQQVRLHPESDYFETDFWQTRQENHLILLRAQRGALVSEGRTSTFARGATIRSVLSSGETLYVTTSREANPFVVIDVSDVTAPEIVDERTELGGVSTYMRRLGPEQWLTVEPQMDSEGVERGLSLRIFDVADPKAIVRTHALAYEPPGALVGSGDPKVFAYDAERKLLAFPYVVSDGERVSSTLELYQVDVDDGFEWLGSVDHSGVLHEACVAGAAVEEPWSCVYPLEVRRALFTDDHVYSVSYGGVLVHAWDDLALPLASLSLPQPIFEASGSGDTAGD